jgi:hypothetical protein
MPSSTRTTHDDAHVPTAAAILADGRADVDALLADTVATLRAEGRRVRGLLMTYVGAAGDCSADMVLVDVDTRAAYPVSQPLGSGAASCRADPQGFARASRVLHDARAEHADLVVCNRFGGLEASGEGFVAELLALMAEGIPVLTAVSPKHRDAWDRFTGGAPLLPAEAAAVRRWLETALATGSATAVRQ